MRRLARGAPVEEELRKHEALRGARARPPADRTRRALGPKAALLLVALPLACLQEGPLAPPLSDCGLVPNYAGDPGLAALGRFRGFPVTVSVDVSGARGDYQEQYDAGIRWGIGWWETATEGRLGEVVLTEGDEADVRISFSPGDDPAISATTTPSMTGRYLDGARIEFFRAGLTFLEQSIDLGVGTPADLQLRAAYLAAHEMGHAFGILGHPMSAGYLMSVDAAPGFPAPTLADVNTLYEAYCRS